MRMLRCLLLALAALAVFPAVAWCQGNFGGVTGHVSDVSGAAVAQATVTLINSATGVTTTVATTQDGVYVIASVPPGNYQLTVTNSGFKKFNEQSLVITTGTTVTLDVKLTLGSAQETVEVTSTAAELQTTSAEIGTTMPEQAMLDLPISLGGSATIGASGRRQIENFTFLTPGVQGNQWNKNINGVPAFSQEILIDGVDMQDIGAPGMIAESTPPYEAVSEFKVQNTLYPAEYGNGLGVENYTLRSGTSRFHGDLFEFVRNDKFDALGFFAPPPGQAPVLRQNEFGGTIGGPLPIPKINGGENKTFFFGSYSGFRLRGGLPTSGLVSLPSMQERNANGNGYDFSDYPYPIFDPTTTVCSGGSCTRQQFPGNIIPANRVSPIALKVLALIPNPQFPGYNANYIDHSSQPSSDDDFSIKIDHTINSKQQLSGAYWKNIANTTINGPVAGPLNPQFRNTPTRATNVRINYTDMISPTLVNHIAFGYTGSKPTWSYFSPDTRQGNQTLQIPGIPLDAPGYPLLMMSGYPWLGNANTSGLLDYFQNWGGSDDVTWVTGKHTVKFGLTYRFRKMSSFDPRGEAGEFNFSNLSTSQPSNAANFGTWGNGFASFLLGDVFSASRAVPAPERFFTDKFIEPYIEDWVQLTPKLTATLGLRYELPDYAYETNGNLSELSLTRPNPGAGNLPGALIFLGDGPGRTGTKNMFGRYYKAFSPRVSLAYSPDGKTAVRLGYGVFRFFPNYGRLNGCNYWCQGFGYTQTLASSDSGITPAMNLDQGFPASNITLPDLDPTLANNGEVAYVNARSYYPSFTNSWTLDIQRQLPLNIMADIAYVGSNTTGLPTGVQNLNQVNPKWLSLGNELNSNISCLSDGSCPMSIAAGVKSPYPAFNGSIAQALRPYPQFAILDDMYQPTGSSNYQAIQVRLQKMYSNGLSFLVAYTLSKNIGIQGADTFGDTAGGGATYSLNTYDPKLERSLVGIDQTHVLTLSWSYALPFGHGKPFLGTAHGVVNEIVGGWNLNAVQTYQSGVPISLVGGPFLPIFNFGGYGGNRPDWNPALGSGRSSVSMANFNPYTDRYLVPTPFSDPAPFTFGNTRPTQPNLRNPAYYDEDVSVLKRFAVGSSEAKYFEFRAECFNLFNRTVFGGIDANIDDTANFGKIFSQTNTPRVIQFGGKFVF